MTSVANKLRLSTAVFAVTAAAIVPAVVAQADDTDTGGGTSASDGSSSSVGSSAGKSTPKRQRGAATRPNPSGPSSDPSTGTSDTATSGSDSSASDSTPADTGASTDIPDEALDVPTGTADATGEAAAGASPFDGNPLFQNPLWWFGTPNPNPPEQIATYEFAPLADLPGWVNNSGTFGWLEGFDFEACVGGVGTVTNGQTVVGPYGTSTTGVSLGCA